MALLVGCQICGVFRDDVVDHTCLKCRNTMACHPDSYADRVGQLSEYLWVGDISVATDQLLVSKLGITHMVDASDGRSPARLQGVNYLEIGLRDLETSDLMPHLDHVIEFIDLARTEPDSKVAQSGSEFPIV
eukprot:TRINITY_DN14036_c0_g1_i2.p1 TRINITY_DN14036_c0_g1~~TRINITY_DN14036_c0_g1_i2.p1  ORF type:complete len:132 (+),score=8.68 TRINITY_DN14036_c0_g1_i2:237-632(+)